MPPHKSLTCAKISGKLDKEVKATNEAAIECLLGGGRWLSVIAAALRDAERVLNL